MTDYHNKRQKFLVIGPVFFDYSNSVVEALQSLDFDVDFIDERQGSKFWGKVIIRVNLPILAKILKTRIRNKILHHSRSRDFDQILVLNPEVITVSDIKSLSKSSKVITYFWDSVKNKKNFLPMLRENLNIFSFDKRDAKEYDLNFLPLFYDPKYEYQGEPKTIEFSFIATMHSDRNKVLERILNEFEKGNKSFIFKYVPSRLMYIVRRCFLWNYGYYSYKSFSFKPLSIDKVSKILKQSNIIIDITHPKQNGLTSRTIEALAAGCKLITTNKSIKNYWFYDESIICVVDRSEPVIPVEFLNAKRSNLHSEIIKQMCVDTWVKKLVGN